MNGLEKLHAAVAEYDAEWRNQNLSRLRVSDGLYNIETDFSEKYPFSDLWGCYIFLGESLDISYIGKASGWASRLGGRIGSYFDQPTKNQRLVLKYQWKVRPRYIVSVAVTEPFEAPSLEEFLIARLDPADNKHGKR
jgi:hypothetical protein